MERGSIASQVSLHWRWMCHRYREQARSHIGSRVFTDPAFTTNPLWERACSRKRWVSLMWCWMYRHLRGQARSHKGSGVFTDPAFTNNPCGSELARESGGSVWCDVECTAIFAGKPAPTWVLGCSQIRRSPLIPVGASLLAKAVGQFDVMLNVPALSRAGSLPHGFRGVHRFCVHQKSSVGASLLAMAVDRLAL